MPNQLNFPEQLTSTYAQRPDRLATLDLELMQATTKQVLFGITDRDVVETWVYNADGTIAGHVNLFATDKDLSLITLIDQTGPQEILNIELVDAVNRMGLQPGRYATVFNFFRDEVGSEAGYKLYISAISDDRTELQLYPVHVTGDVLHDIYEFAEPSVPKLYANALIDQFFSKSVHPVAGAAMTLSTFRTQLGTRTTSQVAYAGREPSLESIYSNIVERAYPLALDNMAADLVNLNVQQVEIETYISAAISTVIYAMRQSGEIDPHFEVT